MSSRLANSMAGRNACPTHSKRMSQQPVVLEQSSSRVLRNDSSWRQLPLVRSLGSIVGATLGLLLVLLIFGAWRPDRFLTSANFTNVLKYNYHFAVAAVGATFVI